MFRGIIERGERMKSEIDIRDFSPKELGILEFFAKSYAENPQDLKEKLLNTPLNDRARTLAFLQRVPALYEDINNLIYGND